MRRSKDTRFLRWGTVIGKTMKGVTMIAIKPVMPVWLVHRSCCQKVYVVRWQQTKDIPAMMTALKYSHLNILVASSPPQNMEERMTRALKPNNNTKQRMHAVII